MESIKVSVSDGNSLSTVSCLHRSKSIVAPFFVPLLSTYNDFCLYSYISFIIIVYRVDKDLGKFICHFYSLLGPSFFFKVSNFCHIRGPLTYWMSTQVCM